MLPSDATPGDLIAKLDDVLKGLAELRVINEEDQHLLKRTVERQVEDVKGRIRSSIAAVNPRALQPSREAAKHFERRRRIGGRRVIHP